MAIKRKRSGRSRRRSTYRRKRRRWKNRKQEERWDKEGRKYVLEKGEKEE